ncbi:pigment epithelium-derived factor [Narcine bancroftii]|uniref:pigment epithelium-derived factor n=1 Tax=Narcine bancroftii TaxID=1343680 RepID=UPI0038317E14
MKLLLLLMLLGATPLASSQEDDFTVDPLGDESAGLDLAAEEERLEEEVLGSPVQRLAYSISEFGYDLYRSVAKRENGANIFLSPLAVAAGLSALSLGADSTNKEILQRILNYGQLQDIDVHAVFKELLADTSTQNKQFDIVSRIFGKKRLRMKQAFLSQVSQYYGARPRAVGTNTQREVQVINRWMRGQRGDKMSQFIRKIPANLSLLLLSAAQHQGQLLTEFNTADTRKQPFRSSDGRQVNIPMMNSQHYPLRYGYDSEINCKIGLLPLHGDLSLLIFLPSGPTYNLSAVEQSLTPIFVHDLVYQLQPVRASVSIPILTIDSGLELRDVLGEMGLSPLLSQTDLSRLTTSSQAFITSVQTRLSLALEEQGLEEASPPSANQPNLHINFHVDRPFILVLSHNPSGCLLYVARVLHLPQPPASGHS